MKAHIKKVDPKTLGILSRLVISSPPDCLWCAKITDGQLERKQYEALNAALEALGGKWNRHAKGHLFAENPSAKLEQVLLTGSFTTKYAGDFFQTPVNQAESMAAWVVRPGARILEPSAGHGRLAVAARILGAEVECGELFEERAGVLRGFGFSTVSGDFLERTPKAVFDGVIMNPPFSGGAECRHILHALKFVKPGGRLISVMSTGIQFRESKLYRETRATLEGLDATFIELPDGTFSDEGTEVSALLVRVTL